MVVYLQVEGPDFKILPVAFHNLSGEILQQEVQPLIRYQGLAMIGEGERDQPAPSEPAVDLTENNPILEISVGSRACNDERFISIRNL